MGKDGTDNLSPLPVSARREHVPYTRGSRRCPIAAGATREMAPPTAINPGQQEIRVDVSVLYAIK